MGSSSAETMAGLASPARVRARAAWISSRRSPASVTTSARVSGVVMVAAWPADDVVVSASDSAHTRTIQEPVFIPINPTLTFRATCVIQRWCCPRAQVIQQPLKWKAGAGLNRNRRNWQRRLRAGGLSRVADVEAIAVVRRGNQVAYPRSSRRGGSGLQSPRCGRWRSRRLDADLPGRPWR